MSKNALHQLIHSLSTFEKGYYIKSKENSHLTTLFKAMNKLEVYDKAALEKRLLKHPELLKHLAKYKNDTYTDVMRVMRSYRQEKRPSVDIRLRVYLTDIAFFIERGLYESAMKLLKDAKKLAMKYEKYKTILEIIHHEIYLSISLDDKRYIEITHTLLEEEKQVLSIINDERRYTEIRKLMDLVYQGSLNNMSENRIAHLDELMSDELMKNKERAVSFISQYRYYSIHALYHDMMGNLQQSYEYEQKTLDCWDANSHQKYNYIQTYVGCVFNFLTTCVRLKEYAVFERLSARVKKEIKPKNPYEEALLTRVYFAELEYYLSRANFDKLDTLITEIKPMLKKASKIIIEKDLYIYRAVTSWALLIMGKYEESYEDCSNLIKQKLPIRIDVQCLVRLFKLMIAYELGYDDFDNLYRATQRFFQKNNPEEIEEAYSLFVEFLYRISHSLLSETKALFVECQLALQQLYDSDKRPAPHLAEILIWIKHIITKESMMDIYKKQVTEPKPVAMN